MTWVGTNRPDLPNILESHSLNEPALRAHVTLYRTIMFGESGLSRLEREAVAVGPRGGGRGADGGGRLR
ncbi:MAG TPA: hypothetical protein VGR12_05395 [Solirubrobacteraceae bacterium]|nr:hypothetical protein [Solirubrobacteraceae bacterium]